VKLLVGVDAGASHTEALVATASLDPLARVTGKAGALRPGAESEAAHAIAETVHAALSRFGPEAHVGAIVVGAAGAAADVPRAALTAALERAVGVRAPIAVTTDVAIALEAAFPGSAGMVVSAGTGSIAFARDASGREVRVGGLGWRFGDEGGGYWIGREALSAVARAADGRGKTTQLTDRLLASTAQPSVAALITWARLAQPREVAALASVVQEAADGGDGPAAEIVDRAARELLLHVTTLLRGFVGARTVPLALTGGVLTPGSPVRQRLDRMLTHTYPAVRVVDEEIDPPLGAVRLAGRGVG
jgi:N-acetylglucosamine kinase-like BadF-type ATPase